MGQNRCVVGECGAIYIGAVLFDMAAVIDEPVFVVDVSHSP